MHQSWRRSVVTNWRRHVPWFPFVFCLIFVTMATLSSCQNWSPLLALAAVTALFFSPFLRYSGLFYLFVCLFVDISFILSLLFCVCMWPSPTSLWHSISQQKWFNHHFTSLPLRFCLSLAAAEVAPVCHLCVCMCECGCVKLHSSTCTICVCFVSLA